MTIGILITARLKSTRLPRKAIKPIKGRPMISHLIERLRQARVPEMIILCTSHLEDDAALVAICEEEHIPFFRGHPDDVLARLTAAAETFEIDTVISCTADNPFVDPAYVDALAEFHTSGRYDYTNVNGLPLGCFAYGLSVDAMRRAVAMKDTTDTEVWGGYFTESGLFKVGCLEVENPKHRQPGLRLTVDTPEDFELIRRIFAALHRPERVFTLDEILDVLDRHPEWLRLNAHVEQAKGRPIELKAAYR